MDFNLPRIHISIPQTIRCPNCFHTSIPSDLVSRPLHPEEVTRFYASHKKDSRTIYSQSKNSLVRHFQVRSGMSRLAFTRRLRGRRTIRSSGPQPAVGGSFGRTASVMSMPITAKSPLSSSQMSGQPAVWAQYSCEPEPILRRNMGCAFMLQ